MGDETLDALGFDVADDVDSLRSLRTSALMSCDDDVSLDSAIL